MTTTVWQGTISPSAITATAGFRRTEDGEIVFNDIAIANLVGSTGYTDLSAPDGAPVVLESTSSTTDTGNDFNSAWSDAAVPPLQLYPSTTYTVTITTD